MTNILVHIYHDPPLIKGVTIFQLLHTDEVGIWPYKKHTQLF